MNRPYYYISDGQQMGPFSLEELAGRGITAETYVWTNGMPDWKQAKEVTEVAQYLHLTATTPPLPPLATPPSQPSYGEELRALCPPTYVVWAVLVTIFCCWILGIPAIINATGVQSAFLRGDYELAKRRSKNALMFTIIGAVAGFLFLLLYIFVVFFIAVIEKSVLPMFEV